MAERTKVGDDTQKSGGDANILQLKDQTKVRLVDDSGAGQLAWRQHTIRHADDTDQVEFVVCPGPRICPLCRKPVSAVEKDGKKEMVQNFPVSKRFATNVWDYGSSTIKVLIAGPQVFDEFKAAKAVNIDPSSCDWIVHKMGKGIQTKYKMVRDNAAPFAFQDQVSPETLIDLDKYGADTSAEKIFEFLEKAGVDYDAIEVPTFTLDEAIEFVLPFGRCKGLTVEQALAQDQEWCEWLHGTMRDEERWAEPVFLALQTVMQKRGIVGAVDETPAEPAPANDETPVEQAAADAGPAMVTLIAPDGSEQTVPKEAEPALLGAGYTVKEEPEPEPEPEEATTTYPVTLVNDSGTEVEAVDADAQAALEGAGFMPPATEGPEPAAEIVYPVQMVKDGAEVEAPTAEVQETLETAGFTMVVDGYDAAAAEPAPPPAPTPIPADEEVTVTLAGSTLPMAFKAALATAKAGTPVEFEEGNVAEYAELLISTGGEPPESAEAAVQSQAEHDMHAEAQEPQAEPVTDPDKPFACSQPGCGWAGKTKGSLTQHMKKQHPDVEPAADAAPAAASPAPAAGGESSEVRERVKALLAANPTKDYKKLLALFDKVAGKRDISKLTDDELLKLEAELKEG